MKNNELPQGAMDCLHQIRSFREWIQTNILFPQVPDNIVHPLTRYLFEAEKSLIGTLYEYNALDQIDIVKLLDIKKLK